MKKFFRAVRRSEGVKLEDAVNVSSYGNQPYNLFSPFTYSSKFRIPVPGMSDVFGCSVEGIWQGLKIIDGSTDETMFRKKPIKRRGITSAHKYGDQELGLLDARDYIYKRAYFDYVEGFVSEPIKEDLLTLALTQSGVVLYDVDENLDQSIPEPLAHSVFLVDYFNDYLKKRLEQVQFEIDQRYNQKDFLNETVAEPCARALEWYRTTSENNRLLTRHFLDDVSERDYDQYKYRYYQVLKQQLQVH
jgi:hypothetical protein